MRVPLLTALAMAGFAANSLLCRTALSTGLIDPLSFTAIRILAGAAAFAGLLGPRPKSLGGSWAAAAALAAYAVFFSLAYVRLDAGIGALALFGSVQLTMIGWCILEGTRPTLRDWTGLSLAMSGLAWLTLPGRSAAPSGFGISLMSAAGAAWGAYSLYGRKACSPLTATAGNFIRGAVIALPMGAIALIVANPIDARGAALAALSGAVTSGLAYAIWYAVLPLLEPAQAAIVQLCVPVLAMTGGCLWLAETVNSRKLGASLLILGGIALTIRGGTRRSSGRP